MKNSMKRIRPVLCAILLVALLLSLCGCGTTEQTQSTTSLNTQPDVTQQSTQDTTIEPATEATTEPDQPVVTGSGLKVHFIDVGQADAALVTCDDQAMLIDGGNAEDSNVMYTYLKKNGITHLDYVIGTHAHEDHIGGIAGALNYATVDTVYCPVTGHDSKAFANFVKAVNKHGATITVPYAGMSFSLGSAAVTILAVNADTDTNNTSIVLRITYGNTSFLFTGDAEYAVEQVLIDSGAELRSTVLKVGHHGSDSSSSYSFLWNVMPQYAVISVGKGNTYGHPTEEVLSRLRDAGTTLYRTDMQGDIIATSNGSTVSFSVSRNANADTFGSIGTNSTEPATEETQSAGVDYIINIKSGLFHYPDCGAVSNMSEKNKQEYTGTREDLIEQGYTPCGWCKP